METKANYLMIGLFTLIGLLGSMAFLLWMAKIEVDRQYAYYYVLFDSVTGLGNAGDVRYNGLPIGQVVSLNLDPDDPSKVRVRIEVTAETPIKTDTVATLQGQGVTGVSFVALSGGSPDSEPLPSDSVIRAAPSAWQSVLEGAPVLLQKAVTLLEDINGFVSDENRTAVTQILNNFSSASGRLDRALSDFESLSSDLSTAAGHVAGFTERLEELADTAETTFTTATDTLNTATDTLEKAQSTLARGEEAFVAAESTLQTMESTFASAETLMEGELAELVRQGTATAASAEQTISRLEEPARNAFVATSSALVEAEKAFATANEVFDEDLETMIVAVRGSVDAFTTTMLSASGDIQTITEEVLSASKSASSFAATLENVVVANRNQLSSFLRLGLPEFLQLTEEARQLVRNLDRFVDRIDRDPARYFLGTQGSEFSR